MDKDSIKFLLNVMIIVCYFCNFLFMFCYEPLDILIGNIVVWVIITLIILGFAFVDWLDN